MAPKMEAEDGYVTPRSCRGKRRGRHLRRVGHAVRLEGLGIEG